MSGCFLLVLICLFLIHSSKETSLASLFGEFLGFFILELNLLDSLHFNLSASRFDFISCFFGCLTWFRLSQLLLKKIEFFNDFINILKRHIFPLLLKLFEPTNHVIKQSGRGVVNIVKDIDESIALLELLPLKLIHSLLRLLANLFRSPLRHILFLSLNISRVAFFNLEGLLNLLKFL